MGLLCVVGSQMLVLCLSLLLLLPCSCTGVEVVFFNTSDAFLTLPASSTISLRSHLAFSFRTCHALAAGSDSGSVGNMTLLEQRGASGNVLGFRLEPVAVSAGTAAESIAWQLVLYWTQAHDTGSVTQGSVMLDTTTTTSPSSPSSPSAPSALTTTNPHHSLADNTWYTVDATFDLGNVTLSIERGAASLARRVVANATFRRFLWDLDVSGSEGAEVGLGFTGCFQGGPGVEYTQDTASGDVLFGSCPLDNPDAFQE
jgi:hypothetical protein